MKNLIYVRIYIYLLFVTVPVVTGVSGSSFLKEGNNASLTEIPGSELESSEFSPSAVKCLHCHKYYGGFETLKEHIQVCHGERAIGYPCLQCNAAFPNRDQLDKHELLHSPNAQVVSSTSNFYLLKKINVREVNILFAIFFSLILFFLRFINVSINIF